MRSLKAVALAATAALILAVGGISSASAQRGFGGGFHGAAFHGGGFRGGGFQGGGFRGGWHGGGWHGGGWHGRGFGWGPAIGAGVALGALATAPYWGGYYYDCGRTVVGYDDFGNPVVANTCY